MGPSEREGERLAKSLQKYDSLAEIIWVFPEKKSVLDYRVGQRIYSPVGRASQMNRGAKVATREFLWFLHSDTELLPNSFEALVESVNRQPSTLHFFDLEFQNDGPSWMWINEKGARYRVQKLSTPWGDQGFAIHSRLFFEMGGFSENQSFGEDHTFIWKLKEKRIPIQAVGSPIRTSARKYLSRGWVRNSLETMFLGCAQALGEWMRIQTKRKYE